MTPRISVNDDYCTRKHYAQFFHWWRQKRLGTAALDCYSTYCRCLCTVQLIPGRPNLVGFFFVLLLFYDKRRYRFSYNFYVLKICFTKNFYRDGSCSGDAPVMHSLTTMI
jgi:hypothetical protein